jgi:c-di-GMP-related signal transduction protein
MSTATATPIRAARGSNFTSKSERKRIRKSMIRAYVSNRVAEVRTGAAARAEFYRGLRQMKERRILIARQLGLLASMTDAAASKASTLGALVDNVEAKTPAHKKIVNDLYSSADQTVSAGRAAAASVDGAAGEMAAFAKRRIYYTEGAA